MRRAQHSSHPVGENPNSKPKVRSNLYLADFEGGPLSTVTILSSIETSTSTVDIIRSENLLSTNYLSSFLLSATHRLVRGDAERRGGAGGGPCDAESYQLFHPPTPGLSPVLSHAGPVALLVARGHVVGARSEGAGLSACNGPPPPSCRGAR